MSLKEKGYAVYWALSGIARPSVTAAYLRERREADRAWSQTRVEKLADLEAAEHLSILPLVEYRSADPALAGEPGVSYLVTVDGRRLLFDVGRNVREEHPSPLLRNMEALGVSVADLDAVFISHNHLDHVGGIGSMRRRTFTLSAQPVDLHGLPAYVPTPMTHPSARIELIAGPRKLGEGMASTGPIVRALWLMGPAPEQALLVNVAGKGVVMIVGCGHPHLSRMIERVRALTDAPFYGVVGGLHFPVTGSRVGRGGQNILGNGKLPWQRITRREAREAVAQLARLEPSLIALSGHDSCDWTMDLFKSAFGDRYREVRVGEEIVVG